MSQPPTQPVPWDGEDYPGHPDPRARTVNNLKFIAWAMHNFATSNGGRLPSAAIWRGGQPLLSWRVAILPWLEEHALYAKFHLDEPWDSPHNEPLLAEMPRVYAPVVPEGVAPHATYYQGMVGPGALFDGAEGTRITDVTHQASPTLMIVETAEPVHWTMPVDLPDDEGQPLPRLGGSFADGFYAAFADGWPRFLGHQVAPATLHALIRGRNS